MAEKTFGLSEIVAGYEHGGLRVGVGSPARQALTLRARANVREILRCRHRLCV